MVTTEDVRRLVADIAAIVSDPERAHSQEDELHGLVLDAIANGAWNPSELAAEALKTRTIDFPRWCA